MAVATAPPVLQRVREAERFIVLAERDGSVSDHGALREGANIARTVHDELPPRVASGP
jgi:hypothetical protein